jgi:predicted metal-binding protein
MSGRVPDTPGSQDITRTADQIPMSLVTASAARLAICGSCSGNRVTEITMILTDGSSVDFTSCHTCETRSWKQDGRELDIATVLGKAQKHKK